MPTICPGVTAKGLLIVPQPPQKRTIFGCGQGHFVFPYSYFGIIWGSDAHYKYRLHSLHVLWSQAPHMGMDQQVYGLPLGNTDMSLGICLYEYPIGESLAELARNVVKLYWAAPFRDYRDGYSYWLNRYDGGFIKKWASKSKSNPRFILTEPLQMAPTIVTPQKLVDTYSKLAPHSELMFLEPVGVDSINEIESSFEKKKK